MSSKEYARTILEGDELEKFLSLVDSALRGFSIGSVYFLGSGSNGKTTLLRKMVVDYPHVFGEQIPIYYDEDPNNVTNKIVKVNSMENVPAYNTIIRFTKVGDEVPLY